MFTYSYLKKQIKTRFFLGLLELRTNNHWHEYRKTIFSYNDGIIEIAVGRQFCTINILNGH